MTEHQATYSYYVVLGWCSLTALLRFRQADGATRCLCLYVIYGMITEMLSLYSYYHYGNNYILYNLYACISLILLGIFFYLSLSAAKSRWVVFLIISITCCGLATDAIYFPEFKNAHQYILNYISYLLIIVIALYSIYLLILRDEKAVIYKQPLFWTATVLVLYEFVNLWGKSSYYPFRLVFALNKNYFHFVILADNILLYAALGFLLWRYPQMKHPEK